MNRFGKVLLASVLAFSMTVSPAFAEESVEDLARKADEANAKVDSIQGQLDQVASEKAALESELTEVMSKIAQLENDLIAKGEEIQKAEAELKAEIKKEKSQYKAMKLRIRYMYESGKGSLISAVLSAEDMTDALNKAEYASEISNYDRSMINAYIETEEQIKVLKANLEEEQAELEAMQEEYVAQQDSLNEMIATKSAEYADFDAQLNEAIAAAAEATQAEEDARAREEAAKAAQQAALEAAQEQVSAAAASSSDDYYSESDEESGSSESGGYTYEDDGSIGSTIVAAAYSQLGVPYVWGGSTPYVALDCSGLVQYCYRCAGISTPRTSSAMAATGTRVSDPQPGDICWTPGHVAIYIGNGQMIEAQQSGVPVKVSAVRVSMYLRYR